MSRSGESLRLRLKIKTGRLAILTALTPSLVQAASSLSRSLNRLAVDAGGRFKSETAADELLTLGGSIPKILDTRSSSNSPQETLIEGASPMRRKIFVSLAAAKAMVLGTTKIAIATHVGGGLNHNTTGATFSNSWQWYDAGQAHNGYHYWGNISDTNCGDSDNVYSKVKVMGYGANSFYGSQYTANV
jgi:hypothetical protein